MEENMNKTNLNLVMDPAEQKLANSFDRDEWQVVNTAGGVENMWQEAASRHKLLSETKKVTLRVNQGDLIKLRARAKRTNVPYQTLLNALIRDFVEGKYLLKL